VGYLRVWDFVAIGFYFLGMLLIGWWSSRKQVSTEEYFVAKRGISSWVAGISMIATLLSTISYLTVPGEMVRNGPGLMLAMLHLPISYFLVGYLVIPHIMKHKVTSAYELLEARFGMGVRQTASALFVLFRIPWIAFIIFTCSYAVSAITKIPIFYLLLGIGIFTTIYTVEGGIRAVMITDVIQFVILVAGGVAAIGYATYCCGGFSWWPDWHSPQLADLHWREVKIISVNPFDRVTAFSAIMATVIWWVCTASSDQVVIQRYLCTRNTREARRSFLNCLLGDLGSGLVLWVVGIALLGFFLKFPDKLPEKGVSVVQQADKLFPTFIGAVLPQGISGLVVAALFAAAMSSLSSGISSIGTVLLTDFKEIFARGCGGDDRLILKRAKAIGVVVGLVGTLISLGITYVPGGNLFEVGYRIGEFFAAPVLVLFLMAFFVPFSTPAGAWAAIVTGFLAGVLFSYWQQIVGIFAPTGDFSIILILPVSILLSLLAGVGVSLFTAPRPVPVLA
jgi:solute:Na+ symporter, SSS family